MKILAATRRLGLVCATVLGVAVALSASAADAAEGGSISGHLTDNGTPVAFAPVFLYTAGYDWVTSTNTDESGAYTLGVPNDGDYKVAFQLPGYVTQWAHQKNSFETADVITVAGGDVTVDEFVAPHGSIAGHVTRSDGSPLDSPYILIYDVTNNDITAQTSGDSNGDYVLPYVPPGSYRASFRGPSGPEQFAHQQRAVETALVFDVVAGERTTLDEQMLAVGTITGHLTDGGQPVSGAFISASDRTGSSFYGSSGEDGSFRIEAYPGTYQVSFQLPGGLTQYAHEKVHNRDADPIVVVANEDTVLEEHVVPTGTISGHLTNTDGNPVSGAYVNVNDNETFLNTVTDDNGFYQVSVFPSSYIVNFAANNESLFAHGRTSIVDADRIAVTAGETVTVDESLLPPGSLTVIARDATTHAPVNDICVGVDVVSDYPCVAEDRVTFPVVGPGRRRVDVSTSDQAYLASTNIRTPVASGQDATIVVDLVRAATVKTVVRDSATGQPVENACLELFDPKRPMFLGAGPAACSGSDGQLTLAGVRAGTYNMFVWSNDGVHGHQWVGSRGGVGAAIKARRVTIHSGDTISLPSVKLDQAGRISGVITDKASGQPIANAIVGISTFNAGFGGTRAQVGTDATGHYTFDELGPYEWPIFTYDYQHASMWSGNTANRFLGTGVKVRPGRTSTYNAALGKGTTLTGIITGAQGQPLYGARITIINAVTGDEMGAGDSLTTDGRYTVQVFGSQTVKLSYYATDYGISYEGWHVHSTDPAHATLVGIPSTGTKTVNVAATIVSPNN